MYGQPRLAVFVSCFHSCILLGLHFSPEDRAIYSHETSLDFHRTTRRHITDKLSATHIKTNLELGLKFTGCSWLTINPSGGIYAESSEPMVYT
jgi:hypothetical protein